MSDQTTYAVQVSWTMTATVMVEAKTEEEAKQIAFDCGLPKGEYVDDSFKIDEVHRAKFGELRDFPGMNGLPAKIKED